MELKYDFWTGKPNEVISSLNRSIGQYTRWYSDVKIGKTNDPEKRMRHHRRSGKGWDLMVVKYETKSILFVNQMETVLIANHRQYIRNEIGGGGGDGFGYQYIYVLLKM